MKFRSGSGAEMLVAHCVWGKYMWAGLKNTRIVDDVFKEEYIDALVKEYGYTPPIGPVHGGRPAFVCDAGSPLAFIFCPEECGIASFVHELGHAVCDRAYPESREWGTEQLEAFALLANANAQRWRTLEPDERASFAAHILACRKSPEYERALRWAFSLRKMKLKDQMDAIARG